MAEQAYAVPLYSLPVAYVATGTAIVIVNLDVPLKPKIAAVVSSRPMSLSFSRISRPSTIMSTSWMISSCVSGGKTIGHYDKIRLVPFGEYVPLKRLLFFVGPLIQAVSDFSAGDRAVVLDAVYDPPLTRFLRDAEARADRVGEGFLGTGAMKVFPPEADVAALAVVESSHPV